MLLGVLASFAWGQETAKANDPAKPASKGKAQSEPVSVAGPDYLIGAEDVLSIVFWRDKEMSTEVSVRPDGKITLPVVLALRAADAREREFWRRTLERGEADDADLEHAIGLMAKHRALEDTIGRAHHYGAIARDALALFPDSKMKTALAETVDFCIARTH